MSPTCGNLRPHLLSDLCRRRRGVHEPVPAIRAGHLAADPTPFHGVFGHRGRVRCHLVHHRIRQQVTLAEPQTRLARADSSHVRNHRFVGGIRLDHLPVFVRPDRRGQ